MLIGLYSGSFKPYHLGHHFVIKQAAQECDKVILIVSLMDRENVLGSDMAKIWKKHIIPHLPPNVETIFREDSPVKHVFTILKARENLPASSYNLKIYVGNDDKDRFSRSVLNGICPNLLLNNEVEISNIARQDTINISGTQIRNYIRNANFKEFQKYMPDEFDKKAIFDILATIHEH